MALRLARTQQPPHVLRRLQQLDNARALLVVHGVVTKAESEKIRRKILAQAHAPQSHT